MLACYLTLACQIHVPYFGTSDQTTLLVWRTTLALPSHAAHGRCSLERIPFGLEACVSSHRHRPTSLSLVRLTVHLYGPSILPFSFGISLWLHPTQNTRCPVDQSRSSHEGVFVVSSHPYSYKLIECSILIARTLSLESKSTVTCLKNTRMNYRLSVILGCAVALSHRSSNVPSVEGHVTRPVTEHLS